MNITHPELVKALAKPGQAIVDSLTAKDAHLLHMTVGVSGEAGELLDAVKKAVIYRKEIDVENVKEELGDLLFYMQGICQEFDFTLEDCKAANIAKLSKRYESLNYSDKAAQERNDKK